MSVKQVIVIRKDLKMRRGKEIAQGAHASVAFLRCRLLFVLSCNTQYMANLIAMTIFASPSNNVYWDDAKNEWLKGNQAKVTLQVESELELLTIAQKATEAGLECHVITDHGLTEFNGVPTKTCLAIGPDNSEKIDPITGHLKLY